MYDHLSPPTHLPKHTTAMLYMLHLEFMLQSDVLFQFMLRYALYIAYDSL
jgi:hypothetical protein